MPKAPNYERNQKILEAAPYHSAKELADKFGVSVNLIYQIVPSGVLNTGKQVDIEEPRDLMKYLGSDYVALRLKKG